MRCRWFLGKFLAKLPESTQIADWWPEFPLTPANTDEPQPVPDLTKHLFGRLFGDQGYISQSLLEQLYHRGLKLITRYRKNMHNRLVPLIERMRWRKRAIIKSFNAQRSCAFGDQLKNICQIQHTRHRSIYNFMVNLLVRDLEEIRFLYWFNPVELTLTRVPLSRKEAENLVNEVSSSEFVKVNFLVIPLLGHGYQNNYLITQILRGYG